MRILTEIVGGVVLLLVFAYGVNETIRFFSTREKDNDLHTARTDEAADATTTDKPD